MTLRQGVLTSAALVCGLVAGLALTPWLGHAAPFVTAFAAVAAAEWAVGLVAALIVAAASLPAVNYMTTSSLATTAVSPEPLFSVVAEYSLTCAIIIALGESLRGSYERERDARQLLRTTLRGLRMGVMTTDADGWVTSMNTTAELLTGWPEGDALRHSCHEVLRVTIAEPRILTRRDGVETPIDITVTVIRDDDDRVRGRVHVFRDVTESRRIERDRDEQLRSCRQLASIMNASNDAIIGSSLGGMISSWNPAAESLFSYSADEAIGQPISMIVPESRLSEHRDIMCAMAEGRHMEHLVTERVCGDGRTAIVSLTVTPVRNTDGHVVGAATIARDVTRQYESDCRERELRAELAAARGRFDAFFEQAPIFAALLEPSGKIVAANRLASIGCGYTKEQVVERLFWVAPWWSPSPELAEKIKTAALGAATGAIFRDEVAYYMIEGTTRSLDLTIRPIMDDRGSVLFLAAMGIDVTERKRLHDELQGLASELASAFRRTH